MARFFRYGFAIVSAISLLLCVAVAVLWGRSHRAAGTQDRWDAFVAAVDGRYAVTSAGGMLTLTGPPMVAPLVPAQLAVRSSAKLPIEFGKRNWSQGRWRYFPMEPAEKLIAGMSDRQLEWEIEWPAKDTYPDLVTGMHFSPRGAAGTPLDELTCWPPGTDMGYWSMPQPPFMLDQVARPLLRALEDPERFVAAHVVLTYEAVYGPYAGPGRRPRIASATSRLGGWEPTFHRESDDIYSLVFESLKIDLHPIGLERPFDYGGSYGGKYAVRTAEARIDPTQRQAIIALWHGRLDVVVATVPYWKVFSGFAALPAIGCVGACVGLVRRRSRRRAGRCVACGYDLRFSPELCPECGAAVQSAGHDHRGEHRDRL